jgi:cytochrome c oxidase subunit 2
MVNWLGLPVQASAHAAELDRMIVLVHWLMLVLFVGWGAFFLFVLVRFRKGANPSASYVGAKGKLAKSTEVLVAVIEIVLLVFYAIPAWATRVGSIPTENEAFVVRVVGEQFAWNIQYPGRDGKFGRVDIKLVSADNPLGLDRTDPNAKDDAIPGMDIPVWFIPTRPGDYEIACSQLCGLGHYRMRGFITIQSQPDFQAWMAQQEKDLATERAR